MKRTFILFFTLLVFVFLPVSAEIKLDVKEHVLSNGLKILMIQDQGVPRVVCHIYYKVGSINEKPGITGLAHMHEHMMFKGTKVSGVTDYEKDHALNLRIDALIDKIYREKFWKSDGGDTDKIAQWQEEYESLIQEEKQYIIKDDLWTLYMKNGGTSLNASTSNEITGYYVTLPSNKVELQMLLESDRMQNAYFREFYSEKNVIMEERRLSENRPGFFFSEQVSAAFYAASPYHWSVLGWMDDLKKVNKADLEEFNNRYYIPNNAVAVYVGDLDFQNIIDLAEKYFGPIPKGPDVEPIRTYEPPQYSEKRLYGEGNAQTSLQMMFHTPPDGHPDAIPLSVLGRILGSGGGGGGRRGGGGGGSGRLYKLLVEEKQMAVSVSARGSARWYAGAFQFRASPRLDKNVSPEDLEKELWAVIEQVKTDGVTSEEIQQVKNRSRSQFIRSLSSTSGLTSTIGRAELNRGWQSVIDDQEALKNVTNEDIKRVAAQYFVKNNSLTAIYKRMMDTRQKRRR